jgi:S-adenosylmethionine decarboxylase
LGTHILLSLYGVSFSLLDDIESIKELFNRVAEAMGATVLNRFCHKFQPQGVSTVFTLAESHISLHSFPENGCVAIDCYTCGSIDTKLGAQMLIEYFNPVEVSYQEIKR